LHPWQNPNPLGCGISGKRSSFPSKCPNSLGDQSLRWNIVRSDTSSLGSNTISVLWYIIKWLNIWNICSMWPYLGISLWEDIFDASRQTSTRLNSTVPLSMLLLKPNSTRLTQTWEQGLYLVRSVWCR
jgi:hypothetical protein